MKVHLTFSKTYNKITLKLIVKVVLLFQKKF